MAKPQLGLIPLEDRVVPAGQVVGTVFLDFNANGLLDAAGTIANVGSGTTPTAADAGVGGVIVTAFDSSNVAQGSVTSAANGSYTLALGATGPYRLEFTNLPAGLSYGPQAVGATGSGTGVQFVVDNPPATPVNVSLVRPTGVTADNPTLVNNVYYFGTTAGATLVSYPYNAGASSAETNASVFTQPVTQTTVATNAQVGTTWGLAYDAISNRTFAAAFTKRHTSFGPNGPGAIYAVDATGATAPALFVDLGAAAAGADFRTGGGYNYNTDTAGFDAVGKTGLGGLDVDDTGTFMYTVGLADRRLYRIALNPDGTAGAITSFAIPVPATASSGGVDVQPFAVEFHNGKVYVGAVDSAATSGQASDLKAYVFAFDPAVGGGSFVNLAGTATATEAVLTTPLDYARGYVHPGDSNNPIPGEWNPWTATRQTLANPGENYGVYPQPMLTGLAFDDAGNVTLGLRDRAGDQFGFLANIDFSGRGLTVGISAGDVLKAVVNTPGNLGSGWTVESNGNAGPGAGNGQGPGGGEFYFQDELPGPGVGPGDDHQEVTVGGLLQLPGRDQVLVTAFDPVRIAQIYNAGGVRWFDTTDGTLSKAYQVYATGGIESTFAKAAGIGDIVAVSTLGREIGNRVWNDTNGNGRQDGGEAGIQGVTVVLFQADAGGNAVTPLATVTTDADGEYYFSSNTGTNTANAAYGLTQLNAPAPAGGSYQIRIPQVQGPLTGLTRTTFQAAGTNAQNDSDAGIQGTDYVILNVGTQPLGTADHSFDAGFATAPAQLSGFVYEDGNNSNTLNAGDTPLPGVTVVLTGTLTAGGTAAPLTTTTDGAGFYSFTNLAPGSYTVTETQPAGFVSRGEQPGTTTGTAPQNGTLITAIPLAAGQNSQNNNFGEVRLVQLSGFVYHDVTNDGTFNAGDAPIPGTTLVLSGTDDLGNPVTPITSVTDGTGAYAFTNLRPGNYTVSETQPAGFSNRTNNPGTVTNGTPGTVSGDAIQTIVLNSNANSPNNNFGEVLTANATLSGFVYEDVDRSSSRTAGDNPIAGTTVVLTGTLTAGGTATPRTTTTDGTGFYSFGSLAPGLYTVSETQPGGFLDFTDQIGSTNGNVANDVLSNIPVDNGTNINSQNNNFGEVRPVQLSGFVYEDILDNGVYNLGTDAPIAGVTLTLTGTDDLGAAVTATQTTAADGSYAFTNLRPGNYTVSETQPAGFSNRTNNPGTVTNGTPGTVSGDAIQTIVLNSNANSPNNNFGEVRPVQLSGFVYWDQNVSNTFNAGDTPLGGVTLTLTGVTNLGATVTAVTTTDGFGAYSFTNLQPGTYQVQETQPINYVTQTNTPGTSFAPGTGTPGTVSGDAIQGILLNSNANNPNNNFGEVLLANATLSGFVYEDVDRSSSRTAGDNPIAGTTVVLTGTLTAGGTATPRTTTTDGTGFYSFTSLAPGLYTVTETQPAAFLDFTDQIGSTNGNVANDVLSDIPVDNGTNINSQNNNFGEVRPVQLSGFVYQDVNNDGTFNAGDAAIAGVTLTLTGTDDLGAAVTATQTTAADGSYAFTNLRPGNYTVSETQPAGFSNRTNNPGTVTNGTPGTVSGDAIQTIVLNSNANSPNNNFGEVSGAGLSGFVYEDNDRSSTFNAGDNPIAGTTVVLTGTLTAGGTATPRTTTTDGTGFYSFTNLAPGSYTVTETQPAAFLDFNDQIGGTGGNVANDVLSNIPVDNGTNINSQNNNFGEVRPVQLSGFVYHDVTNDGTLNLGDQPIGGVTVVLTGIDDLGNPVTATTTTASNGGYGFANLRPGNYTVSETQPANFTTRTNTPGFVSNGTPGTASGDTIQTIVLNSGANSLSNNFGEVLTANASLSGFVYQDVDNSNALTNAVDQPIPGTIIVLTGTTSTGQTITPLTRTTGADGSYAFTGLQPGTYIVTQTQPAGFLNRGEQPGSTGGTAPQTGTVINLVPLASAQDSINNNFGEVLPASLSGTVYQDLDNNGGANAGDASIPGVTVVLTGTTDLGNPVTLTQTTDSNGNYAFTGLRPGTYTVSETQPAGFDNRTNNPGTVTNGTSGTVNADTIQTVRLNSGASSPNNNFGEIAQVPPVAQLSGYVFRDPNLNGVREPGNGNEPGLAGVPVTLFREDAPGVLTQVGQTTTDAVGFYTFVNLPPGLYRVAQTQPANFLSTQNAAGTTGGTAATNNTIFSIPLAGGQNSQNNNFGEVPCTNLFGYVWVDGNQNGIFDPGELPVAGTQVTLSGTAYAGSTVATPITAALAGGPLTVTTDSNGRWSFTCLPPGTYSVNQTNTPAGFNNFQSQNSSGLPVQGSSASNFSGVNAQVSARGPLNFGIVPSTPQAQAPSKQNFLGSSCDCFGNPLSSLVDPAVGSLNTTPPFNVSTGGTTPTYVAAAAGAGFAPVVRVFDYAAQTEVLRIQAFEETMTAGVRVATGDISGDGVPDIIAAAGPGAGPRIRVFDGVTGTAIRDFYAYPSQFRGGLYVATGDFNGDGRQDIVTGAGEGGGPNVRVFDGATGTLLTSFFAFDSNQTGGARIAVGDFNGDGTPDIAASNGPGNTSLVRTFSGRGFSQMAQFTPYNANYTGGVFLAAGDVNGDGVAELVSGADQGGGPNVRVFNASTGQLQSSFFAYESSFTGGVRVAVRDITGDGIADIITGAGLNGASRLRVFSGANLLPVEDFYVFNSAVRNGLYLG